MDVVTEVRVLEKSSQMFRSWKQRVTWRVKTTSQLKV